LARTLAKNSKQGEAGSFCDHQRVERPVNVSILTQEKLSKALFPVGDHPKAEIRILAEEYKLPSTGLAESQDLCFLAGEDYRGFLLRHAPKASNPGPILTDDGKILGEHRGLAFYTIGQRKGLGITSAQPLYVLRKEAGTNSLVVGLEGELGQSALTAGGVNWISGIAPSAPFQAMVKTRYTSSEAAAVVTPLPENQVKVIFDAPQRDITAGQAAVFYCEDVVLGGGTIL
jgi:tRNA-specific 2-thiouridylase